jgi:hypothetical protein
LEAGQQQVVVAQDGGEQIVQVVGQPARQPPDRLPYFLPPDLFLPLPGLPLCPRPLGHAQNEGNPAALTSSQQGAADQDRHPAPVLADILLRERGTVPPGPHLPQRPHVGVTELGRR